MFDTSNSSFTASLSQDLSRGEEIRKLASSDQRAALEAATRQFEGLFIQMMLKSMRATVSEDGLFSSSAIKSFKEMQDSELARRIAAKGGLGLTNQIVDSVIRQAGIATDQAVEPAEKAEGETADTKDESDQTVDTITHLQQRGVSLFE